MAMRYLYILCLLIITTVPKVTVGMEFRLYFQPELSINVVIGEGEIVSGDAERFLAATARADRDSEGHIVFVLNSLGGSVRAAFELVEVMDAVGVYTVVPDNALCASACASIVFVSGTRRNVVGTGRLGFHSCYAQKNGRVAEDSLCNHLIAQNAVLRGLSYASVDLFVKEYGADDMAWVGRDVACTMLPGLCRPTLRKSQGKNVSPSFDCNAARTKVEHLICSDSELSRMDQSMAAQYKRKLLMSSDSTSLKLEQRKWLSNIRNQCLDKNCLVLRYQERIRELLQ